jgi:hypothetical protein
MLEEVAEHPTLHPLDSDLQHVVRFETLLLLQRCRGLQQHRRGGFVRRGDDLLETILATIPRTDPQHSLALPLREGRPEEP